MVALTTSYPQRLLICLSLSSSASEPLSIPSPSVAILCRGKVLYLGGSKRDQRARRAEIFVQNPGIREPGGKGPGRAEPRPASRGLRGDTPSGTLDKLGIQRQECQEDTREKLGPEKRKNTHALLETRKQLCLGPRCKDRGDVLDKSLDGG